MITNHAAGQGNFPDTRMKFNMGREEIRSEQNQCDDTFYSLSKRLRFLFVFMKLESDALNSLYKSQLQAMCLCWSTSIQVDTYIHTFIHTYIHTYIHSYIDTFIHTYIHTYLRMHVRTLCYASRRWSWRTLCSASDLNTWRRRDRGMHQGWSPTSYLPSGLTKLWKIMCHGKWSTGNGKCFKSYITVYQRFNHPYMGVSYQ